MAKHESFDVTSEFDLQEVDNAVNQARAEVKQRYDLKKLDIEIDFQRAEPSIGLKGPDAFALKQVWDVLLQKMVRRGVPVKNLHRDPVEEGGGGAKQHIALQQGIPEDTAKKIVKEIKGLKMKKVQTQIQGAQLRVMGPKRDDLQAVMAHLKEGDWGVELQFGNYR